ncbi:tetratricopeptide repeat protein [Pigmentiphaga sp.]|uniref:tetratricopeptide repeat protein n=1 Tax=Pigmentiphaga sp. TaxID=1977564 RepID=UPI0025E31DC1|nr:tetratricopeptide repeat protein [Pigmentiphaga sp.]MBX6317435.1 tetratricopeptide repeat protein [Pigmentiphaga sp.]
MAKNQAISSASSGTRRGRLVFLAALATLASLAPGSLPAQTTTATPPALAPSSSGDIPWLSNFLDRLKPGVDTSLPESTRAMVERLERQLAQGTDAADTLAEIDERLDEDRQKSPHTVNAQLLFLKAAALNQLNRREEAKDIYRDMTQRFPELPEPWNNLAVLEAADGRLDEARTALEMAIRTAPDYAVARENLGDLYIMLAARSYDAASKLDPSDGTRQKGAETRKLLEPSRPSQPQSRTP